MGLDVEFYTFNIDDGLEGLKSLIGEDKFDHVFALSIWAHCDENKLADMINFYTDKICWFEGHNTITYGDTKSKMDLELERLLDLPYHEYIGETNDRSIRQNYKLSRSLRIDLIIRMISYTFQVRYLILLRKRTMIMKIRCQAVDI